MTHAPVVLQAWKPGDVEREGGVADKMKSNKAGEIDSELEVAEVEAEVVYEEKEEDKEYEEGEGDKDKEYLYIGIYYLMIDYSQLSLMSTCVKSAKPR